jgi:histidinol-phosphate aminotransferase
MSRNEHSACLPPAEGSAVAFVRTNIAAMKGYVPGYQPPDEAAYIKLNTNENPYPPSPLVKEAILKELGSDGASLRKYPSASSSQLREIAGKLYGFDPSWIIMANGSDEVLNNLIRAFAGEGDEVGYVHPSYSYYATLAEIQGARVRTFGLTPDFRIADFPDRYDGKLFFLTTPNSPLGFAFPLSYVQELAGRCDGVLVVDEAYADFAEENALDLVKRFENVVVTRTLSKSYSLAGMRLGLAVARPEVIAALDKIRDHYNLDRLAQAACAAALEDQAYFKACTVEILATRQWFMAELRKIGYTVTSSQGNFVFAAPPDRDGKRIYDGLFARKILVRHFTDPLLAHGLRISIGTREEMEATLKAIQEIG